MAVPEFEAHESQFLPAIVWVGKVDTGWPLYAFESADRAQRWQAAATQEVRRIWELRTETAVERRVRVVPQEVAWES